MKDFFSHPRKPKKNKKPAYASTTDWAKVRELRAKALSSQPELISVPDHQNELAKKLISAVTPPPTAKKAAAKKPKPSAPSAKPEPKPMLKLVQSVTALSDFKAKLKTLGTSTVVLDHVTPRAYGFAAALLAASAKKHPRVWVVCGDTKIQDQVNAELAVWQMPALYFPRLTKSVAEALPDPEEIAERVTVLAASRTGILPVASEAGILPAEESKTTRAGRMPAPPATGRMPVLLVLCADSLYEEVPAIHELDKKQRHLSIGDKFDTETFAEELEAAGYERVPQVTERGQFARRGGIFDFFCWQADEPFRIELFDEEIESLRSFDVNDQGSIQKLDRISFIVQLTDDKKAASRVRDHIGKDDLVIGIECEPDVNLAARITFDRASDEGTEDFSTAIHDNPLGVFDASDFVIHEARREQFAKQLAEWHHEKWQVIIFFHNDSERERFEELCPDLPNKPQLMLGMLYRGFVVPTAKLAVLTGAEIFGRHQITRRIKNSKLDQAQVLRHAKDLVRDLKERDLVVHSEHGIGKFMGVELRDNKEVMVLSYSDDAKLYVPLQQAHLVCRYVGVGNKAPSLNKLGDTKWSRTRKNAERSVEEFAAKMLSVAAERRNAKGLAHAPDTKWQAEFEGSFIYRETPDQLRSVEEIKRDMEGDRPMDRLLCADVGFGKTEVAIRAAFKAVMGGRQVAILAPTTVLVSQHLKTLRERMSEFPVSVEMMCRMTPPDKEREIVKGLADGSVDIVVGTHRLLSKDIVFKDLGFAVVDEEQRFGVKHKERFKEMFRLIDVLTLSATPIPRTLYLALMGMRDMSTIETPPPARHAVQTTVCPYDERVIRDAINAELDRNGQVFFLHNRVSDIEQVKAKISLLCPRARIVIGHGQMEEGMLETVMHKFVSGEADVLVCTTIIESGVDVPNANTIIIDRADRFGLADLYQLRGRVGRGDQRAHAYLLLPRDFTSGGDARKRVNAIKQYTALGSGFKIAMRDLEIRGAGNLLGTEQSGHIAAVGFDLYCQMLKQAVNKSQGRRGRRPIDVAVRADFLCLSESAYHGAMFGTEPAFIPGTYIEDGKLRIQAYRALAEVSSRKELEELEKTWQDQFGKVPRAITNLLQCAAIRLAAAHHEIASVEIKERKLMLQRGNSYIMVNGKFPRLAEDTDGVGQLSEALEMLRRL